MPSNPPNSPADLPPTNKHDTKNLHFNFSNVNKGVIKLLCGDFICKLVQTLVVEPIVAGRKVV